MERSPTIFIIIIHLVPFLFLILFALFDYTSSYRERPRRIISVLLELLIFSLLAVL